MKITPYINYRVGKKSVQFNDWLALWMPIPRMLCNKLFYLNGQIGQSKLAHARNANNLAFLTYVCVVLQCKTSAFGTFFGHITGQFIA